MTDLSTALAQRLKELRKSKGLTYAELSEALKTEYGIQISKESLTNYEVGSTSYHTKRGKNEGMNVKFLRCLADFYGVTTDYLLGRSEVKSPDGSVQGATEYTGLSENAVTVLHQLAVNPLIGVSAKGYTVDNVSIVSDLIESKHFLELISELSFYMIYGGALPPNAYNPPHEDISPEEFARFDDWANSKGLEINARKDVAYMHLQKAADLLKTMFTEELDKERGGDNGDHNEGDG